MIIGIGYKARVGKDTAGSYIASKYNYSQDAFARNLKNAASHIFGFTQAQLEGDEKEIQMPYWNGLSPRMILQRLGTDCLREFFGQEIWVNSFHQRTQDIKNLVVTDVRFPNEAAYIKRRGGILINITKSNTPKVAGHSSEVAMDKFNDWDYTITNDGTYEELYTDLDTIIREIGREQDRN